MFGNDDNTNSLFQLEHQFSKNVLAEKKRCREESYWRGPKQDETSNHHPRRNVLAPFVHILLFLQSYHQGKDKVSLDAITSIITDEFDSVDMWNKIAIQIVVRFSLSNRVEKRRGKGENLKIRVRIASPFIFWKRTQQRERSDFEYLSSFPLTSVFKTYSFQWCHKFKSASVL